MNILKKKNLFFGISGLIILIGLVMFFVVGLNYGIDFTGGTLVQIEFGKTIPVSEIRQISNDLDPDADVIHAGDGKTQVIIKTKKDLSNEERKEFFDKFQEKYQLEEKALIQSQKFGPAMGQEIANKAVISILIATLGMLAYITFRFELKFGIAAVIALVHDVLIVLSVYAVFKFPVNSSFVASILTIVGYSINDTIVVFDRIRENLRLYPKKDKEELVNESIAQTISRSINTSFTTLLAIASLYIFGVEAIKDFALPLIAGVLTGTYSSIFIASPVWTVLEEKFGSKRGRKASKVA